MIVVDGLLGGAPWADRTHKYSGEGLNYIRWGGSFYQDTKFDQSGPIIEVTTSCSFNMNGRSGRKAETTFGKEQF